MDFGPMDFGPMDFGPMDFGLTPGRDGSRWDNFTHRNLPHRKPRSQKTYGET
jgi:hypothetical protein